MQFWHRRRARRIYPLVRSWPKTNDTKLLGFGGYKVGMLHAMVSDNRPNSPTKGESISIPVTVLECPPIKVVSLRFYKKTPYGLKASDSFFAPSLNKDLARKIRLPKETKQLPENIDFGKYHDINVQVYTCPRATGLKKKPEIFEVACGGSSVKDKFEFAKSLLNREIKVGEFFKAGEQVDTHGVSKGKGYQGPVKRFGISIRSHKSEKTKRGPGSLGAWTGNRSWTVSHAGQMGFHTRMEFNKQLIMIGSNPEFVNPAGGFIRYGKVKSDFVLLKGSVVGAAKRFVRFNHTIRSNKKVPKEAPLIEVLVK